jgi:hypothetical protein
MVVFLVHLEMFREIRDAVREHRDLYLRRAGVRIMLPKLRDQSCLGFLE